MKTPILLITFNRPEHTRRVLEAILAAEPKDLYVFQDGGREGNENDKRKCAEVRQLVEEMTAGRDLSLHVNYSNKNLGCGPGPMTAINWFFIENEMGIIIEDDAIPHKDFFVFCEDLLARYKEDDAVRAIGSMCLDDRKYGDGSYYFSMMNRPLCSWATWRRAWKDFDLYHRQISRKQFNHCLKQYGCGLRMREYWCERLLEVQKDAYHHSSWDQQFWFSIWLHQGKGIMPNVNLSTNIGFDESATHSKKPNHIGSNRESKSIVPIVHPSTTVIQRIADSRFQKLYFEPENYGWSGLKRFPYRMNKRIKRLVGHEGSWFKKR